MSVNQIIDVVLSLKDKQNSLSPLNRIQTDVNDGDYQASSKYYLETKLTSEQEQLITYLMQHPGHIVLVQAGAGSGKTHALLTLAYRLRHNMKDQLCVTPREQLTIAIFKHDSLFYFRQCACTYTIASLFMSFLNVSKFMEYTSLEKNVVRTMTNVEYIHLVVTMMKKCKLLKYPPNHFFVIDEYTMVPKIFLFLFVFFAKKHKITLVVCGDKNQLPPIMDSIHSRVSSYNIIKRLCHKEINFTRNLRCLDPWYSRFLSFIAAFSSNANLDPFAYFIVALYFPTHLFRTRLPTDTFIGGHHSDITFDMHRSVTHTESPVSFYEYTDTSVSGAAEPINLPRVEEYYQNDEVGKFLPYLPLIVGQKYYYETYSEHSVVTLLEVRCVYPRINNITYTHIIEVIVKTKDGTIIHVPKSSCNKVLFNQHKSFLLQGVHNASETYGKKSLIALYNFPLYPTNMISVHMAQGRTITEQISFNFLHITYQGLYVCLSRLRNPTQVNRITIPTPTNYLVSVILAFPELIHMTSVQDFEFSHIMTKLTGCRLYNVPDANAMLMDIHLFFLPETTVDSKQRIYDRFRQESINWSSSAIIAPNQADFNKSTTLEFIIQHQDVLYASSCLESLDLKYWIYEFCRASMFDVEKIDVLSEIVSEVSTLKPNMICIKNVGEKILVASSRFQFELYNMYISNNNITVDWLINQLDKEINNKKGSL